MKPFKRAAGLLAIGLAGFLMSAGCSATTNEFVLRAESSGEAIAGGSVNSGSAANWKVAAEWKVASR